MMKLINWTRKKAFISFYFLVNLLIAVSTAFAASPPNSKFQSSWVEIPAETLPATKQEMAAVPTPVKKPKHFFYVEAGTGLNLGMPAKVSTVFRDEYVIKSMKPAGLLALGVGLETRREATWFPGYRVGLEYSQAFAASVQGKHTSFEDHWDYHYTVSQQNLLLIGKAQVFRFKALMPYVSAGLGLNWTQAQGYHETLTSEGIAPNSPDFRKGSKTQLSYSLGIGLDYAFSPKLSASLDYSYAFQGVMQTGADKESVQQSRLRHSLQAQAFKIQIRYFIV